MSGDNGNRPELFFALVGPAGANLDELAGALRERLAAFAYEAVDIRLSELLPNFTGWVDEPSSGEYERIRHLQKMGDAFREKLKDGAALARAGITAVRRERVNRSGNPDKPLLGHAFIIRQLKHPDEVELFRETYGGNFYLVAAHAPRKFRITELSTLMARKESRPGDASQFETKAIEIIEADEKQESDFGQNTRDTYPKADFFANVGQSRGWHRVERFVDLLFGHPFRTPTPEEYAMYQASAVALRSSDDSRQVGAVIISLTHDAHNYIRNADVIAVGMNEVPRGGGGFYWDEASPDYRDQALLRSGEDRAKELKISALVELIERMVKNGWINEAVAAKRPSVLAKELLPTLKGTQFVNIGEFSRPVHAEMSALLDAARRGVAVEGHSMYVTTFPCHNCAKHIIAAGIKRVVYLEPYPKSRARTLHGEEIELESEDGLTKDGKVVFCAFSGVAPRLYRQVFSMSERGSKKGVPLRDWERARRSLSPRYVMANGERAYLQAERQGLDKLANDMYRWSKEELCSDTTGSR